MSNSTHLNCAILKEARLEGAHLERANLVWANLEGADLEGAHLKGAYLEKTNLRKAKHLSLDQLSKVKTLYNAKLDKELEIPLREKYPALFEKPDQDET